MSCFQVKFHTYMCNILFSPKVVVQVTKQSLHFPMAHGALNTFASKKVGIKLLVGLLCYDIFYTSLMCVFG